MSAGRPPQAAAAVEQNKPPPMSQSSAHFQSAARLPLQGKKGKALWSPARTARGWRLCGAAVAKALNIDSD